jgi:hypothetical protein
MEAWWGYFKPASAAGRGISCHLPQPQTQKADSEIFNKFGSASGAAGVCTMGNHDFVSDGFLALIAAGLLLLCSSLLVIAFA